MSSKDEAQVVETPFANVLTAYMWSKTPPWSANKLAAALGISRARMAKWTYHGSEPSLDTMMHVLAKLDIPLSTLVTAYEAAHMPAPALTSDSPANEVIASIVRRNASNASKASTARAASAGSALLPYDDADSEDRSAARDDIAIPGQRMTRPHPNSRIAREARLASEASSNANSEANSSGSAESEESVESAEANTSDAEWKTMIEHTRRVMRATGMSEAAIEEMVKHLRDNPARASHRRVSSANTQSQTNGDKQPPQASKRR